MRHFFPGEMYAAWTKAEELSYRIVELHAEDVGANDTKDKRRKRLHKRRTDLNTMLDIIGGKTDQYNFDDVLKLSFSLVKLKLYTDFLVSLRKLILMASVVKIS